MADRFADAAPCGLLVTRRDGRITQVNRTFCDWAGFSAEELLERRFTELLPAGGRIYHETHLAPLLQMQGAVREIALELATADGERLPILLNATIDGDEVRIAVFTATDRRSYERELVRLREQQRSVAEALQRSMLESTVPDDARYDVATYYKPGTAQLEVGGDWHDVFAIGTDRVGLVVGDVVGRGLEAASAMGRLRSAARALAMAGLGPDGVLEHLDAFVEQIPTARSATLACVDVHLDTGHARLACAGHPPPIRSGGGTEAPELLWEGRSAPLGAYGRATTRPGVDLVLEAGSRLFLYTDGAVERRDQRIDVGIDRLIAHVDGAAAAPVGTLVDRVAAAVAGTSDDVCLLAFELTA